MPDVVVGPIHGERYLDFVHMHEPPRRKEIETGVLECRPDHLVLRQIDQHGDEEDLAELRLDLDLPSSL